MPPPLVPKRGGDKAGGRRYLLPPPWTRPNWETLNKGNRMMTMSQYNRARANRGFPPIQYNGSEPYPPGFSAANINKDHPKLLRENKAAADAAAKNPWEVNPLHYQTTERPLNINFSTDNPLEADHNSYSDLSDAGSFMNVDFSDSENSQISMGDIMNLPSVSESNIESPTPGTSGVQQDKTPHHNSKDQPPAKKPRTDPLEGGGTVSETESTPITHNTLEEPPITAPQQTGQETDMVLTGTGQNGSSMPSTAGGETTPNSFISHSKPGATRQWSYTKMYKMQIRGNAPTIINNQKTVSTFANNNKLLVTNLSEIPVNHLAFYLTPGEYTYLSQFKNVYVSSVHVVVGKKSTQAAFETNASTTSNAVLNYNKTLKMSKGLNKLPFYMNMNIATFDATKTGTPSTLTSPLNWTDIFKEAWTTTTIGGFPAGITRSHILLPNVYCQSLPTAYTDGWYDHSTDIKEIDDDDVGKSFPYHYNYKFEYAPITPHAQSEIIQFPSYTTQTAIDTGTTAAEYVQSSVLRSGRKRTIKADNAHAFTGITDVDIDSYNPLSSMTFAIDDVIEKAQYCFPSNDNSVQREHMQDSLHVGIGEVPALNPFRSISAVADLVSTKFVPQMGELWVKTEIKIYQYDYPLYRTNSSVAKILPESQPLSTVAAWPKVQPGIVNSLNQVASYSKRSRTAIA